jgi:hypothetical protein
MRMSGSGKKILLLSQAGVFTTNYAIKIYLGICFGSAVFLCVLALNPAIE